MALDHRYRRRWPRRPNPAARAIVDNAEVFVGGARHLSMVPQDGRERLAWPSPICTLLPEIEKRRGRRVCVLATGDPLHYGVGTTILRGVDMDEVTIVPGRSAFTMATARLGWARHEVECLTLHGRAFSIFNAYVQPGAKLLILTDDGSTPAKIADALCVMGYGESRITVFERMDSASEGIVQSTAADWRGAKTDDFNTVAVECIAGSDASSREAGRQACRTRYAPTTDNSRNAKSAPSRLQPSAPHRARCFGMSVRGVDRWQSNGCACIPETKPLPLSVIRTAYR